MGKAPLCSQFWPGCYELLLKAEYLASRELLSYEGNTKQRISELASQLRTQMPQDWSMHLSDLDDLMDLTVRALEGGVPLSLRWSMQRRSPSVLRLLIEFMVQLGHRVPWRCLAVVGVAKLVLMWTSGK